MVLLGDTHNSAPIKHLAQGAHLISHEATFLDQMYVKARIATHSTGVMAGEFAREIQAKQLVLTHFSGRYGHTGESPSVSIGTEEEERRVDDDLKLLKREAEQAMGSRNVACAFDGFTWRL